MTAPIDVDTDDAETQRHAAAARRALLALLGEAPQDGDQPAGTRFARDLGAIAAIAEGWIAGLAPTAHAVAWLSHDRAAHLLSGGHDRPDH
jgi:hypothetical protein